MVAERSAYISYKGHELVTTLYHFPSNCEACTRPLWNVFKPPPAVECRRCHVKCHKDHLDLKEEVLAPCKGQKAIKAMDCDLERLNESNCIHGCVECTCGGKMCMVFNLLQNALNNLFHITDLYIQSTRQYNNLMWAFFWDQPPLLLILRIVKSWWFVKSS